MTEKISLTELQLIIRDSLYLSLPDAYWVIAEISELKENSAGHCYLELIEKNPDEKNVRARVKAIIWNNRYRFLKALFENATGENLREGLKVLIKTKVEYHELFGLSLIISDIDPAFTMGEMAVKRQLIIKKLEQDGVISMNKDLTFPALPQRIAVISSKTAAGYSDFINHLKINSFGYSFFTTLIEATLQGSETEQSVIGALHKIALEYFRYDIVVIIRGGGSQSDLSWFDNYNIAYFITQFPIPVITGIGHEKDISVTDLVAHKALKTPTAVADFLIESVSTAENHIMEMSSEIIAASRIIIEKNKNIIESSRIRLFPLTRIMISGLKDKLSSEIIEIIDIGKELVVRAWLIPANQQSRLASVVRSFSSEKDIMLKQKSQRLMVSTLNSTGSKNIMLNGLENKLQLLNPENILQRGYSITTIKGKILRKSDEVKKGDIVETRLNEGSFKSKVVVRERKEKEADEEGQIELKF